jgi:hypothetical protein
MEEIEKSGFVERGARVVDQDSKDERSFALHVGDRLGGSGYRSLPLNTLLWAKPS